MNLSRERACFNHHCRFYIESFSVLRKRENEQKHHYFLASLEPRLCRYILELDHADGFGGEPLTDAAVMALCRMKFLYPLAGLSLAESLLLRLISVLMGRFPRVEVLRGEKYLRNPVVIIRCVIKRNGVAPMNTMKLFNYHRGLFRRNSWMFFASDKDGRVAEIADGDQKRMTDLGVVVKHDGTKTTSKLFKEANTANEDFFAMIPPVACENRNGNGELILNPGVHLTRDKSIPEPIKTKLAGQEWLRDNLPTIWIDDNITQAIHMYTLSDREQSTLGLLINGAISTADLDVSFRNRMAAIGVLVDPREQAEKRAGWEQKIARGKADLKTKRMAVVNDFLDPVQLGVLKRYVKLMDEHNYLALDTLYSTSQRFWNHQEELTALIHRQVEQFANRIVDGRVKPASNALAIYRPGAKLPRHKDDVDAYAYVVSLVVYTEPETDRDDAWPIYAAVDGKEHEAKIRAGDFVMMDPHDEHWRDHLTSHSCCIMLLWFVDEKYSGNINGVTYY